MEAQEGTFDVVVAQNISSSCPETGQFDSVQFAGDVDSCYKVADHRARKANNFFIVTMRITDICNAVSGVEWPGMSLMSVIMATLAPWAYRF